MSISHGFPSRGALDHLVVRGTIDVANAPEFRTLLLNTIEDYSRHLVIDVTDVDFADPSGLGVLNKGYDMGFAIEPKPIDLNVQMHAEQFDPDEAEVRRMEFRNLDQPAAKRVHGVRG